MSFNFIANGVDIQIRKNYMYWIFYASKKNLNNIIF